MEGGCSYYTCINSCFVVVKCCLCLHCVLGVAGWVCTDFVRQVGEIIVKNLMAKMLQSPGFWKNTDNFLSSILLERQKKPNVFARFNLCSRLIQLAIISNIKAVDWWWSSPNLGVDGNASKRIELHQPGKKTTPKDIIWKVRRQTNK